MASTTDILDLIDAYTESRHLNGAPEYNSKTRAARDAVVSRLHQGDAEMRAVVEAARNWYHTGWDKYLAAHELAMAVLYLEQAEAARQSSAGGEGQA